jgi:hypothetical protein
MKYALIRVFEKKNQNGSLFFSSGEQAGTNAAKDWRAEQAVRRTDESTREKPANVGEPAPHSTQPMLLAVYFPNPTPPKDLTVLRTPPQPTYRWNPWVFYGQNHGCCMGETCVLHITAHKLSLPTIKY